MRISGKDILPVHPDSGFPELVAAGILEYQNQTFAADFHPEALRAGTGGMHPVIWELGRSGRLVIQRGHLQIAVGFPEPAGRDSGKLYPIPAVQQTGIPEGVS
ncbi:hypothetical protein D3C75_724050 [compost metagenome]